MSLSEFSTINRISTLERQAGKAAELSHVGVVYFLYLLKKHGLFAPSLRKEIILLDEEYLRLGRLQKNIKSTDAKNTVEKQEIKVKKLRENLLEKISLLENQLKMLAGKMTTLQENDLKIWRTITEKVANENKLSRAKAGELFNRMKRMMEHLSALFERVAQRYEKFRKDLAQLLQNISQGIDAQQVHVLMLQTEEDLLSLMSDAEIEARTNKLLMQSNKKVFLDLIAELQQSTTIRAKHQPIELPD